MENQILCIAFASPRVGNDKFARAFHELELRGKIHFIRVVNDRDIIPLMPERPILPSAACNDAVYRSVGLELRLYPAGEPGRPPKLILPRVLKRRPHLFVHDVYLAAQYCFKPPTWCYAFTDLHVKYHSCLEYLERLAGHSDELKRINGDQLLKLVHLSYQDQVRIKMHVCGLPRRLILARIILTSKPVRPGLQGDIYCWRRVRRDL